MFARARDFTLDLLRRIGLRIFHHDSSGDKHKKLKHSDAERQVFTSSVVNSKREKNETNVTTSGDDEKQAREAEKIVITSEPDSQTKEENDSQPEYNEVTVSELMETNIDAIPTSEEIKPKQDGKVTEFCMMTTISDQEPTSTVDVLEPQEPKQESFLGTEEYNDFKEVVAQAVTSTDTVGSNAPEPDSALPEIESQKLETSDEPETSKLEALVESASIPESGSQETRLANSQPKLEDDLECNVQVTESTGTHLDGTDSSQTVKSGTEQRIEEFSAPELQVQEVKSSDEGVMGETCFTTNEVLPVIQPAAVTGVAESRQGVPIAVHECETEIADEIQELLKPDAIEETPVLGDSEMQANEEHLESFDHPQHEVYESEDLIGTEDSIEVSNDANEVPMETTDEKIEEHQFERSNEPMQPQKVIPSVKDDPEEVMSDEEIKESINDPVELMKTSEFVNADDQGISKNDENLVAERAFEVEEEKEVLKQIKLEEMADNVEFEEQPSVSQDDGVSNEARELRKITDTMPEFESIQVNEKLVEVAEQVDEQQGVFEAKHIEVDGIKHESESKSANEVVASEAKQPTSSEDVKDEIQHTFLDRFHEKVVELGTKFAEEMSSGNENEGGSLEMNEKPVEIRQAPEDPGSKMSEGFEETENIQVESPLSEEKADVIQDESKEQSHEEVVEFGTKLSEEMSSANENEGESLEMNEEPVEVRQASEDPESKMSEGFEETEDIQVESPLCEVKADEIQDEFKEHSDEITLAPEVKSETKVQGDIGEPHQESTIFHEEPVKSDQTENKVEERISASESEKEEIIGSEAEETRIFERTLVEPNIVQEQEDESGKELQEPSKTDDVREGDWMASNAESDEIPTATEEGTEEEGGGQRDEAKSCRKRRRRHGRNRYGKGKH
ncbi:unnamed protein product [Rodentolepis nana]|uniref:RIIa domain-containing protein n=1 Tax=Rodentolepis nana TaxID=102285 RepID=A0A0R3T9K4_RODNA|nr:unnamed protein product [Rodentolepis nana]